MPSKIAVKHNIEVAHRLYELPGKCEQIHGHSMQVTLWLRGKLNDHGILDGIEFGPLKKSFRKYLDETFDHRLLLNASDPYAGPIFQMTKPFPGKAHYELITNEEQRFLPGLQSMPGDPTTENIAMWIGEWGLDEGYKVHAVDVWETAVNMSRWKP